MWPFRRLKPYARSTVEAAEYLRPFFAAQEKEICVTIFLDADGRVIDRISHSGGSDWAPVIADEIAAVALTRKAAMTIIAHNHPGGSAEFGKADKAVTKRLTEQLRICNSRLVDHLLFAEDQVISMREQGLL